VWVSFLSWVQVFASIAPSPLFNAVVRRLAGLRFDALRALPREWRASIQRARCAPALGSAMRPLRAHSSFFSSGLARWWRRPQPLVFVVALATLGSFLRASVRLSAPVAYGESLA
jgi:hypothetical protein